MKSQYLWAVFLLGFFLMNYPLFQLYNVHTTLLGIPALYLVIFLVLAMSAGLTFWIVRKTKKEEDAQ